MSERPNEFGAVLQMVPLCGLHLGVRRDDSRAGPLGIGVHARTLRVHAETVHPLRLRADSVVRHNMRHGLTSGLRSSKLTSTPGSGCYRNVNNRDSTSIAVFTLRLFVQSRSRYCISDQLSSSLLGVIVRAHERFKCRTCFGEDRRSVGVVCPFRGGRKPLRGLTATPRFEHPSLRLCVLPHKLVASRLRHPTSTSGARALEATCIGAHARNSSGYQDFMARVETS